MGFIHNDMDNYECGTQVSRPESYSNANIAFSYHHRIIIIIIMIIMFAIRAFLFFTELSRTPVNGLNV